MPTNPMPPARSARLRPIWSFARRLGVRAAMSVTVMAGLQLASINGYDVRDVLPGAERDIVPSRQIALPTETAGVPARFDVPVQAGTALDHIGPPAPAQADRDAPTPAAAAASEPKIAQARSAPVLLTAALTEVSRIAVPTPRPHRTPAQAAAIPPHAHEVPFDVSPRGVEVYDVAELAAEEAPPMPIDGADTGFRVGDLVPSGTAILTRTAEVTGSAAHAVTGTATRLLDLVR